MRCERCCVAAGPGETWQGQDLEAVRRARPRALEVVAVQLQDVELGERCKQAVRQRARHLRADDGQVDQRARLRQSGRERAAQQWQRDSRPTAGMWSPDLASELDCLPARDTLGHSKLAWPCTASGSMGTGAPTASPTRTPPCRRPRVHSLRGSAAPALPLAGYPTAAAASPACPGPR